MNATNNPSFGPSYDSPLLTIDLRNPEHRARLEGWGGANLFRVKFIDADGKFTTVHLTARVSGDSRAGSQKGAHFGMEIVKPGKSTQVERHARGYFEESK